MEVMIQVTSDDDMRVGHYRPINQHHVLLVRSRTFQIVGHRDIVETSHCDVKIPIYLRILKQWRIQDSPDGRAKLLLLLSGKFF